MRELTAAFLRPIVPARSEDSSKATYGSVLNVAGSVNYRGAAVLSSVSALRVGAGYVTLACPAVVANAVCAAVPDVVIVPLRTRGGCVASGEYRKTSNLFGRATAVSIGCGLSGVSGGTTGVRAFFTRLVCMLAHRDLPVVIDADGLNFLAALAPLALPRRVVLTPHERELSRLLRTDAADIRENRRAFAELAAKRFSAVVVLKGHRTIVTDGERTFVNTTGNSALSKAGSGDVLTGMTAGLCAQGLSPLDAACLAVFLHGRAGELASADMTEYGVLASDLPSYIPRAIASLR